MYKRKKRNKIQLTPFGKVVFTVAGLLIVYLIALLALPNFKTIPFYEFFTDVNKDEITMVVEDKIVNLENSPVFMDDELYIPVAFVKEYIDEYIFWDEAENKLTITTEKNVIRMKTDELTYYVNNEPLELGLPVYSIEEEAYMPTKTIEEIYKVNINFNDENKIAFLDYTDEERKEASIITKSAVIRFEPDFKSPIAQKLEKGALVSVFDTEGNYSKVRSTSGLIGWINSKNLSDVNVIAPVEETVYEDEEIWKPESGKINMVFDQVTKVNANNSEKKRIVHDGLDVISPTWFSFENTDGDIKNIADKNYVDWAHSNGYQVWALITDNFNNTISHAVLSSTETREHVIKQLLAYTQIYDLDGINIDFENVPKSDGEYYVQFMRELTPLMKQQGLIVSADVFMPRSWTAHYNRGEVSKIIDYMIVMGYDEHYSGSPEAGSVASYDWSVESVEKMLEEGVPKEKLILGIPFYTRIWKEEVIDGKIDLSCTSYGMDAAYEFMNEKNAEIKWLDDMGQDYAEVTEENTTYKVWLEDVKSVEKRVKLINEYDIAGCAAWKRGLENESVWPVLKKYLKEQDSSQ